MRADSALSHLYDGELCIATTDDGEHVVRWQVADWRFHYVDGEHSSENLPVCRFEEIKEWRLASMKI